VASNANSVDRSTIQEASSAKRMPVNCQRASGGRSSRSSAQRGNAAWRTTRRAAQADWTWICRCTHPSRPKVSRNLWGRERFTASWFGSQGSCPRAGFTVARVARFLARVQIVKGRCRARDAK